MKSKICLRKYGPFVHEPGMLWNLDIFSRLGFYILLVRVDYWYFCDQDALVQACVSEYDQKFENSSEKVKQAKFGKCSKKGSAIVEELFGEARNSSVKKEAFCFSNSQTKNI